MPDEAGRRVVPVGEAERTEADDRRELGDADPDPAGGQDGSENAREDPAAPRAEDPVRETLAGRMADRLHERRERHLARTKPHRAAVVALGFVVTLGGIVLAAPGVPGPGFLVILIGLALLAQEFTWAERLLQRSLGYLERAGERAAGVSTRRKIVIAVLALAALAAFGAALLVFEVDLPFLR